MNNGLSQAQAALHEAQKEFPPIIADADNPFFNSKYADLPGLQDVLFPILHKNGFTVTYPVGAVADGFIPITARLTHSSGEALENSVPMPVGANPTAQSMGSLVTYGRRYALCALLGIAPDKDDDGNAASRGQQAQPASRTAAPRASAPPANTVDTAGNRGESDIVVGTCVKIKDGTTNGRAWTIYEMTTTTGEKFATFDHTVAAALAAHAGKPALIKWEVTKRGGKAIKEFVPAQTSEGGDAPW